MGQADMDDLSADPIVEWQHQHYAVLTVTMAVIRPTTVAGLGWRSYLCWLPENVFCPASPPFASILLHTPVDISHGKVKIHHAIIC
jgi:hypothetical protein